MSLTDKELAGIRAEAEAIAELIISAASAAFIIDAMAAQIKDTAMSAMLTKIAIDLRTRAAAAHAIAEGRL